MKYKLLLMLTGSIVGQIAYYFLLSYAWHSLGWHAHYIGWIATAIACIVNPFLFGYLAKQIFPIRKKLYAVLTWFLLSLIVFVCAPLNNNIWLSDSGIFSYWMKIVSFNDEAAFAEFGKMIESIGMGAVSIIIFVLFYKLKRSHIQQIEMKMKIIYSILILLFVCMTYFGIYFYGYHIKDSPKAIQSNVAHWIKSDNGIHKNLKLLGLYHLKPTNSYIALMQDGDMIHDVHLIKGWNGQFKIEDNGFTNSISFQPIITKDGDYGILFGTNPNDKITHATANLNGSRLFYEIPEKKYFVVYKKLTKKEDEERFKQMKMTTFIFNDKSNNIVHLNN